MTSLSGMTSLPLAPDLVAYVQGQDVILKQSDSHWFGSNLSLMLLMK